MDQIRKSYRPNENSKEAYSLIIFQQKCQDMRGRMDRAWAQIAFDVCLDVHLVRGNSGGKWFPCNGLLAVPGISDA